MDIKYLGEQAVSYLIDKCKATFALITHTHTAEEVGADAKGSASVALALAEEFTMEQIDSHTHTKSDIEDLEELTGNNALTLLMEQGMIDPVSLDDGSILLDENNNILVL